MDLASWLKRQGRNPEAAATAAPAHRPIEIPSPPAPATGADHARRAASYLSKIPTAISGQRGHDRTFHAACVLIKGFGLTRDQARPLLEEWNRRCEPPWSEAELEHKLRSAEAAADDRPRGYLAQSSPGVRGRDVKTRLVQLSGAYPGVPPRFAGAGPKASAGSGCPPPPAAGRGLGPPCPEGHEANPHRLAGAFLTEQFSFAGRVGLRFWREEYHLWDGSAYRRLPTGEIRARLSKWLADEFDRLHRLEQARWIREQGDGTSSSTTRRPPRPISVTSRMVTDVLQAVSGLVLIRAADCPGQPAWIDDGSARPDPGHFQAQDWPVSEILPARNLLVHLPSFVDGRRCTVGPTPSLFNAFALDYDFVPGAPEPVEWLAFLRQVWEHDDECIACLQEWFGYLLTPDTRHQKVLMMVGPKRSGRGTIARVLKALVSPGNVVNPTLATLARPFGLATLIDKPVAVFPDARLSSRPDNAAIAECLLSVSGEDDQTIDRKHLPSWTGRLPTRFVLISNELPRLRDASGALASRLILLPFTRSFYGKEDTGLFDRLRGELPGILLWAIAGWKRLRQRGRFIQPRSGRELLAAMGDLASPISAFLRDNCVLEQGACVPAALLYEAWRSWCQTHGRDAIGDEASFGRDLHAAIPGLSKSRFRVNTLRVVHYTGIRLRTSLDPDMDDAGQDDSPAQCVFPGADPSF